MSNQEIMRIAFFGGCILKQNKLEHQNHFHALVLNALNNKLKSDIDFSLEAYWHYNNLGNHLEKLLKKEKLDFVVLFMRAFPLLGLLKPIIKYKDSKGKLRWIIHPKIIGLKRYQNIDFACEVEYVPKSHLTNSFKNIFRNLNFSIGKFLQLDVWTVNYLVSEITAMTIHCEIHHSNLIIAGPTLYLKNEHVNALCILLSNALDRHHNIKLNHVSLVSEENLAQIDLYCDDQLHLNENGHQFFADQLLKVMMEKMNNSKEIIC